MENKDILSFDHFLESEDKGTKKTVEKLETKENKAQSRILRRLSMETKNIFNIVAAKRYSLARPFCYTEQ
jgi:hypothetical protein